MKRIQVQIVRSTAKAHLVASGDRQGWIRKSWIRDDGTVSKSTFDRAAKIKEARDKAQRERQEFRNAYHTVTVARETAKAVMVDVDWFASCDPTHAGTSGAWIAKSLMKGSAAPGWILAKKIDEVQARFRAEVTVESVGGVCTYAWN